MKAIFFAVLAASMWVGTAEGQDLSLESTDYFAVDPSTNEIGEVFYASVQNYWVLTRETSPALGRRPWVQFILPQIDQPIESAVLRLPLGNGSATDRRLNADWSIFFYDADVAGDLRRLNELPEDSIREIWNDVGSGNYYGVLNLDPAVVPHAWDRSGRFYALDYFDVHLSPLAIRDINESAGNTWSIGSMGRPFNSLFFLNVWSPPDHPPIFLDLTYGPPPPLGDFSGNGRVEQSDLDFALLNWGVIDQEELDAVLLTWGEGGLAAASVPEPVAWTLTAVAFAMAAGWRKRLAWSR